MSSVRAATVKADPTPQRVVMVIVVACALIAIQATKPLVGDSSAPCSPPTVTAVAVEVETPYPLRHYRDLEAAGAIPRHDAVYVTLVTSPDFVEGALVLLHSISMTGSRHARYAAVTANVSVEDQRRLALVARVVVVESVKHSRPIPDDRYFEVMTKLRMWDLTQFKKVVYLDVDMVVVRNIDDLFDLPELSVMQDMTADRFSTGLMVLVPNATLFHEMVVAFNQSDSHLGLPDLFFLTAFFRKKEMDGSKRINYLSRWHQVYQAQFNSTSFLGEGEPDGVLSIYDPRVKTVHYPTAKKPWLGMNEQLRVYTDAVLRRDYALRSPRWAHDPNFLWYVHRRWMLQTLALR